jgi:hypothetical protein
MEKGYARGQAYKVVQEMTLYGRKDLVEVLKGIRDAGHITEKDLEEITSLDRFYANVETVFSRF